MRSTAGRRGLLPGALAAGYAVLVVGAGLGRLWWPSAAWLLLVGLATTAALAAAAVRFPLRDPPASLSLAASAGLFTLADVIFAAQQAPPVRPVDVLYAPAYALAVVALYRLSRRAGRAAGYLDTAVLAAGLVVLVIAEVANRAHRSGSDNLLLLYPLAGLVVLTLSVRLAMSLRTPPSWLMLGAAVWLLASGLVPMFLGHALAALLVEILHVGMLACWGLAALLPPPDERWAVEAFDRRPPMWLFAVLVLLAPVALLIRAVEDLDTREVVLAVACAVAGLFVVTRLGAAARASTIDPVTGLMVIPVLLIDARTQPSSDFLHCTSARLVRDHDVIVIEDLAVNPGP